jgi:hopanoid biosynthesis associated RND transporter like protein HpnN
MARSCGRYSERLLEWWVVFVLRHRALAAVVVFLLTAGVLFYSLENLKINADTSEMISEKLPFRKLEKDFSKAFPQLSDTIVVVLNAGTAEQAISVRRRLADRLRNETGLFKKVYEPGGESFFERNGLLYLSLRELEELADNLAMAQPLIALLAQDLSIRGLFSMIGRVMGQTGDADVLETRVNPLLSGVSEALERAAGGQPYRLSWQELMLGDKEAARQSSQFIILHPYLDLTDLSAGKDAVSAVRRIIKELNLIESEGVKVGITGDVPLSLENKAEARRSVTIASLVSFLLVGITLYIGFGRSGVMVCATLATLIVGLILTTGFAIAFVGKLNLISVTFTVLFIGLGIDYGIQFCNRYQELSVVSGLGNDEAIVKTVGALGDSLRLCTVAAAIGFYSFLPTAYTGVSELGLIAGTGMFINLFATLTVLPMLLSFMPPRKGTPGRHKISKTLSVGLYRHSMSIRIGAVAVGVAAAVIVPKISFDYNPLNLFDPRSEAVVTIKELFRDGNSPPWTISVLAGNATEASELSVKLRGLSEVKEVITLSDLVPDRQSEKLEIISNIALFMPKGLNTLKLEQLSYEEKVLSLERFAAAIRHALSRSSDKDVSMVQARRLYNAIEAFRKVLDDREGGEKAFHRLENGLLLNLPVLFHLLDASLEAHEFTQSDLPEEVRAQYVTPDGRRRVVIVPRENILNAAALERFVDSVSTVAPNAIDTPVTIRESGRAVARSFIQAIGYALLAITVYLIIDLKSVSDTLLVLFPLALSLLLTGAASVLLDIPFNFANVIVMPLLIGSSVEGIYLVRRFRTEPPKSGNMLETGTASALLLSALTTITSFSTLSFSPHRGMASMGKLLTLCMSFLIISNLVLLPSLLKGKESLNPEPSKGPQGT